MSGSRSGSSRCPRIGGGSCRTARPPLPRGDRTVAQRGARRRGARAQGGRGSSSSGTAGVRDGVLPSRRPCASRRLRMAPGRPRPVRARVLGKASMFTEQSGEVELRQAFDGFHAAGAKVEAAVAAIDLAMAFWQHRDAGGRASGRRRVELSSTGPRLPPRTRTYSLRWRDSRCSPAGPSSHLRRRRGQSSWPPRPGPRLPVSRPSSRARRRVATWGTTATRTSRKRSRWRNDTISARSDGSTRTSALCSSGAEISSGRRPSPVKGFSITSAPG